MHEKPGTAVLEEESRVEESRNAVGLNIDDDPLTVIFDTSANTRVRCPWLGNEIVTLSEAVLAYSANVQPITKENIHLVAAIMQGLLDNPVLETEGTAEENSLVEETSSENGAVKEEKSDRKNILEVKTQNEKEDLRALNTTAAPKEKIIIELDQPASNLKKAILPTNEKTDKPPVNQEKPIASETLPMGTSPVVNSVQESKFDKTPKTFEPVTASKGNPPTKAKNASVSESTIKTKEASTSAPKMDDIDRRETESHRPALSEDKEPEAVALSQAHSHVIGFEKADTIAPMYETITELDQECIETPDNERVFALADYQIDDEVSTETRNLNLSLEEYILQPQTESVFLEDVEATEFAPTVQANLSFEEIESTLIELAETIEANDAEAVEPINEILNKIIEAPAKLSGRFVENRVTEAELQEELEELFINLLDKMGIGYTPELVESLAYLTIRWRLADEIEKMIKDEEPDALPQASGTHEIIKKLLRALSTIKKAITHSVAIGKSALRLYNISNAQYLTSQVF